MKFKTHVPNAEASAILSRLFARELSISAICRLSGVSRKAVDGIRAGKNCRKATFDKLAAALAVQELQEMTRKHLEIAEMVCEEANREETERSVWERLKNWFSRLIR